MKGLRLSMLGLMLIGVGGCGGNRGVIHTDTGDIHVECIRAIDYQARKVKISGVEVPFSPLGDTPIKIGSIDVDPKAIRDASDLIQFLDITQFAYCQSMLLAETDANRKNVMARRDEVIKELIDLLKSLQNSKTASEYTAKLDEKVTASQKLGFARLPK